MTEPRRATAHVEREAAARRMMFAATLAGFVAIFGLIAVTAKAAPATIPPGSNPATAAASGNRVLAAAPIANLNGDNTVTIVRIMAPGRQATAPHVRTRAS